MAKTKANRTGGLLLECRRQRGLTQDQVAAAARERGLRWSRTTVTSIEIGRRALTLDEFLALRGAELQPAEFDAFFTRATDLPATTGKAAPRDADVVAAKKLGITPDKLTAMARKRWGRTLSEERDRIFAARQHFNRSAVEYWRERGEAIEAPSMRGVRGHITRELLEQLAASTKGRR